MRFKSFFLAVILLVSGQLAFSKRGYAYIEVTSNVRGAYVLVNGKAVGLTPGTFEVRTGYYMDVEIGSPGYIPDIHKDCCILKDGWTMKIYGNLKPKPTTGSISVSTPNTSGASVYIDGSFKGYAPCTVNNLSPGYHSVRVTKYNCKDETASVYVVAGETSPLQVTMKMTQVQVSVTNVSGVSIYLDGSYKGTAPLTIEGLSSGYHTLRASKGNFDDEELRFYISDGETKIASFTMKAASLAVRANVSGASVYVDGVYQGTAPITISNLEPGRRSVKLTKTHYKSETQYVDLVGGYISSCDFNLEKISGYLSVTTNPSNATVSLGGKEISKSNYEIDEGTYTIKMKAFGYEELSDTVKISRNMYTTVNETMEKAPFRISSFSSSVKEFNPKNKNVHNTTTFSWSVNGPEKGEIDIIDGSGRTVGSIPVSFTNWTGYSIWDGKFGGRPLSDGIYTARLTGGQSTKETTFTINSKIKDYDQSSRATGLYFDFGRADGAFFDGFDVGMNLYFGGTNFFGGFGASALFANLKDEYISGPVLRDFNIVNLNAFIGGSFTFHFLRPYLEAGVGYYFSNPMGSRNSTEDMPNGFSFTATAGCDFIMKNFSLGGYYRLRYLKGAGWIDSYGVAAGFRFN